MADLTASLRRVPRWAWYTSAGVGLGATALYVVRNRAVPEDETPAAGDAIVGGYGTTNPSPMPGIVVPDINMPANNAGESGWLDIHTLYIDAVTELLGLLSDQTGTAPAPAPAPELPPIVVQMPEPAPPAPAPPRLDVPPSPAPAPGPPAPSGPPPCPGSFPHRGSKGCYKNCGHCDRRKSDGKHFRNHAHCYQNGERVHVHNEYPGGCP